MDRGTVSQTQNDPSAECDREATVVPIRPGVPLVAASPGEPITGETWRLLHALEAANEARDTALDDLDRAREDAARFREQRNALLRLNAGWRRYADDVEEWADAMAEYQQSRVDAAEAILLRMLHEKEHPGLDGDGLTDAIAAAHAWLDRWPPAEVLAGVEVTRGT